MIAEWVEEAAAASQSLEKQGRRLTQSVAYFRLGAATCEHAADRAKVVPTTRAAVKAV
jgi:hypothetical protein